MIKIIEFNNTRIQVIANPYLFQLSLRDGEEDESGIYPKVFLIIFTRNFPKKAYFNISVKNGHFLDFQLFNLIITTWSH